MRKESVIDYGEYIVSEEILKALNRNNNKQYSIFAPLSKQEKGVDLILFNRTNRKTVTIQVKSSRSYVDGKDIKFNFLWLNNFNISEEAYADYYIIVGNYLNVESERLLLDKGLSVNVIDYIPIILVYSYDEMVEELKKIRLKTKDKPDRFFGFKFREENDIEIARGYVSGHNTLNNGSSNRSPLLLKNKVKNIIDSLE